MRRLQFLRIIAVIGITCFVAHLLSLETSSLLLCTASASGVLIAGILVARGNSSIFILSLHIIASIVLFTTLYIANLLLTGAPDDPSSDFAVYKIAEHLYLLYFAYLCCGFGTWLYWTNHHTVTLECLFFSVTLVWIMSGHRNYYLDAPQSVAELAWQFGIAPQHFLIGIGVVSAVVLGLYLSMSSGRPLFQSRRPIIQTGKAKKLVMLFTPLLALTAMIVYALYINASYSKDLSRATNGVAEGSGKEGDSPLGFHSSIGKNKQPAALVRLESDYKENPKAPMLYLREEALSTFNGKEFVYAGSNYDNDCPKVKPGQVFMSIKDKIPENRTKITQSVYLLSAHKAAFGLDYPHTIRLIKNPDKERFKLAYQVESHAPAISLENLIESKAGNPKWDTQTWQHYLRAPGSNTEKIFDLETINLEEPLLDKKGEDLRYKVLAQKISKGKNSPLQKALAVTHYLSKESIYTRAPGHEANQNGDPVAPYLFGSPMKGYCVHFAHAAVYMIRLLGIPARIGTGYLTDLNYAKDGHILLHLGDRHAWPEIYLQDQGWVVVDIAPERAENEQPLIPDERLLEELMSKIDPAEALVEPEPITPEEDETKSLFTGKIDKAVAIWAIAILIILWLTLKLLLRFGYLIVPKGTTKSCLAYISFASTMTDLGFYRNFGETRQEYCTRLKTVENIDSTKITLLRELDNYSKQGSPHSSKELKLALLEFTTSLSLRKTMWVRSLVFFSLRSILSFGRL